MCARGRGECRAAGEHRGQRRRRWKLSPDGHRARTFAVADRRQRQTGRLACLSALAPTPSSSVGPTRTLLWSRRPPATLRGAPTPATCRTGWSSRPRCQERARRVSLPTEVGSLRAIWRELADRDERSQTGVASFGGNWLSTSVHRAWVEVEERKPVSEAQHAVLKRLSARF